MRRLKPILIQGNGRDVPRGGKLHETDSNRPNPESVSRSLVRPSERLLAARRRGDDRERDSGGRRRVIGLDDPDLRLRCDAPSGDLSPRCALGRPAGWAGLGNRWAPPRTVRTRVTLKRGSCSRDARRGAASTPAPDGTSSARWDPWPESARPMPHRLPARSQSPGRPKTRVRSVATTLRS